MSWPRHLARWALGLALAGAGVGHLTSLRREFQAQVPGWLPLDPDFVVVASGAAEIGLGAALIALPRQRRAVGWMVAAFFVAVFPGNVSQYLTRTDAFGLNTDGARLTRLIFQPLLVLWALWCTGRWPGPRRPDQGNPDQRNPDQRKWQMEAGGGAGRRGRRNRGRF